MRNIFGKHRRVLVRTGVVLAMMSSYLASFCYFIQKANVLYIVSHKPEYPPPVSYYYASANPTFNKVAYVIYWPLIQLRLDYEPSVYIYDTAWMKGLRR